MGVGYIATYLAYNHLSHVGIRLRRWADMQAVVEHILACDMFQGSKFITRYF